MDPHLLNAALAYGRAGWPVMPLAGAEMHGGEMKCSCHWRETCVSPAKHPRTKQGLYDASTDEETIRGWFRSFRTLNIGVRTGIVCDVVDVDEESKTGGDGYESLMAITCHERSGDRDADVLAVWPGPVVRTGHGWHLFLKPQHHSNRAKLMTGIDYRGDGGYIVAPPSVHVTGQRYEWLRKGPMADEPTPWLNILMHPPRCPFVVVRKRSTKVCNVASTHDHGDPLDLVGYFRWVSGIDQMIAGDAGI